MEYWASLPPPKRFGMSDEAHASSERNEKMKNSPCQRVTARAMLSLALLAGLCCGVLAQSATPAPTAQEQRVLIVKSDGASSVQKVADQPVKIKTASGESAVPLSKIVYIFRGKARVFSENGIQSGEVLDSHFPTGTKEGAAEPTSFGDILFLGIVQPDVPGEVITRYEIIVADGKVTKNVLSSTGASRPGHRTTVVVLDEYFADRLFTLSNPSYNAVLKKGDQGLPFPVDVDIVKHQASDKHVVVSLNIRSLHMERFLYWRPLGGGPLVEGAKERKQIEFVAGLEGFEGPGEVYLYVAEGGTKEVHDTEAFSSHGMPQVRMYKTVSNILRLPVRFE